MTDDRLPVPLDASAARWATLVAVLSVVALLLVQSTVAAAVTGSEQPVATAPSLPASPTADDWDRAPSKTVSLSKQRMAVPFGGGSTDEVTVRTLTNDSHVAFRMTWQDPTRDANQTAPRRYSDAAAIMFRGGSKPPITMGAVGEPVNIWYWRASWESGERRNSEWTGDMYAYPHPDNETKPGEYAGNPISTVDTGRSAQNYYAKGFGSLTHAAEQDVRARSVYRDGEWSVVLVRERATQGAFDAAFDESEQMYLAFAVWNGSADEANGQKSITLQFTTLDTASGEFSQASSQTGDSSSTASSGGASSADSSDATSTDSGGSDGLGPMYRQLGTFMSVVIISWTVAYWRLTR